MHHFLVDRDTDACWKPVVPQERGLSPLTLEIGQRRLIERFRRHPWLKGPRQIFQQPGHHLAGPTHVRQLPGGLQLNHPAPFNLFMPGMNDIERCGITATLDAGITGAAAQTPCSAAPHPSQGRASPDAHSRPGAGWTLPDPRQAAYELSPADHPYAR